MFKRPKQPQVIIEDPSGAPLPPDPLRPQPLSASAGINTKTPWFKRHKKVSIALLITGVVLLSAGVATALYFANRPTEVPIANTAPTPPPPPPKYYSALTGVEVETEAISKQAATAIIIENSPDARPQSGLKDSGVVFEAIAEGGITRFLVVYQEQKPQLVGPVRSLRMYYVDWLTAFDPSIAHVGGSAAALQEVRNGNYRDIDQFFNPGAYWRATDRYAPHNVYTSFERLDELNQSKGFVTSDVASFDRTKEAKAVEVPTATSIAVTMSSPLYNSGYTYNAETNSYDRSQGGQPHLDREAGQISPRVVVVLEVQETTVLEDGYRESINAIGSGTGYVFQNGEVKKVTWNKASRADQISFVDEAGAPLSLAPGQTWISAVPVNKGGGVTWQ